jgi:hypothetical protein
MHLKTRKISLVFCLVLVVLFGLTFWLTTPLPAKSSATTQFEYIRILCWNFTTGQATFYAAVSAAIFTCVAFFGGLVGLNTSMQERRKERAHAMAAEWNSKDLRDNVRIIKRFLPTIKAMEGEEEAPRKIFEYINEDEERRDAVITILGVLEDWAIGIHADYFDERVLELSMCDVLKAYWLNLQGFIIYARAFYHEPSFYIQLQKYVEKSKKKPC